MSPSSAHRQLAAATLIVGLLLPVLFQIGHSWPNPLPAPVAAAAETGATRGMV